MTTKPREFEKNIGEMKKEYWQIRTQLIVMIFDWGEGNTDLLR